MCRFYPRGRAADPAPADVEAIWTLEPPGYVKVCAVVSIRHAGRKLEVTKPTPWRAHVTRAEAEAGRLGAR
jgi:hypothetical protein